MRRTAMYIFFCAVFFLATVQTGHSASYYVSAIENNSNDGLSEKTAFSSLDHAVSLDSNSGENKHIVVIGILSCPTHFVWNNTGLHEIVMTGKAHAAAHERAVLTYLAATTLRASA